MSKQPQNRRSMERMAELSSSGQGTDSGLSGLDQALARMAEDVPPVPPEFSQSWRAAVRKEATAAGENLPREAAASPASERPGPQARTDSGQTEAARVIPLKPAGASRRVSPRLRGVLSMAAAMLFLLGGTLMVRPSLLRVAPRAGTEKTASGVFTAPASESAAFDGMEAGEEVLEDAVKYTMAEALESAAETAPKGASEAEIPLPTAMPLAANGALVDEADTGVEVAVTATAAYSVLAADQAAGFVEEAAEEDQAAGFIEEADEADPAADFAEEAAEADQAADFAEEAAEANQAADFAEETAEADQSAYFAEETAEAKQAAGFDGAAGETESLDDAAPAAGETAPAPVPEAAAREAEPASPPTVAEPLRWVGLALMLLSLLLLYLARKNRG